MIPIGENTIEEDMKICQQKSILLKTFLKDSNCMNKHFSRKFEPDSGKKLTKNITNSNVKIYVLW